jgi:diacylglycerol kinase family enzyme
MHKSGSLCVLPPNKINCCLGKASSILIILKHKVHFQVDGEYLGKVDNIAASILPGALEVIVA